MTLTLLLCIYLVGALVTLSGLYFKRDDFLFGWPFRLLIALGWPIVAIAAVVAGFFMLIFFGFGLVID